MFKGLFKSAWKSDSVEKRLAFINDVDTSVSANQTILESLASSDVDASVRQAAQSKITDLTTLYKLWQSPSNNEDSQNLDTAFKNLIQSGNISKERFNAFYNDHPQAEQLLVKYCPLETIREQILSNYTEVQMANIISGISFTNTRVMLAEKIHEMSSLEIARKGLKGKDKKAEKIIKSKINAIHAQQKQEAENNALAKSIREKMESLARYVTWSDEIKDKFFTLSKNWDALDFEPDAEEKTRYDSAYVKVKADVKNNMAFILAKESQQTIVHRLEQIAKTMTAYPIEKLISERKAIENEISDLALQWNSEAATVSAIETQQKRFDELSQAINSSIVLANTASRSSETDSTEGTEETKQQSSEMNDQAKAVLHAAKSIQWPAELPKLTAISEAIESAQQTLNINKQSRKEAKQALDKLHQKINRLFGIARRGEISRANRELASITKASENYDGFDRVKLDERLEEVTETVRKMGDWKDFAIEPKLIELCEKMEALPELEKQSKNPSANNLAKKIKALQDQWKHMGSSDISETYWPRFKEAGDKAYEPCAEFFEKRREIQQANLEKREPFIAQMQALFDSTNWDAKPDYKAVEDTVSQIMQNWKKIKDVEHGRGQKQWEKFVRVKDQINEKLDVEYDKNIKTKHSLIEQLEQMAELELDEKNNEQTLEKLKFTQSKWKQIGVTRRKQDQKAWDKFKIASDAVYAKIQGVRQEKRAVEDEQIDAYKALHKQIHQLAKSTQDLRVSDKAFETLVEEYKNLPKLPTHLPEKLIERLDKDYARACDAYTGAKDRLHQAKLDNEIETLDAKAKLCTELEQLPKNADDNAISELQDKIKALEISNKDYLKRFDKRLKKARDDNREEYAIARRLLLIDCEILLDVESPKEDKELRLQIQLDRMKSEGLGNAPQNNTAALEEMQLQWLCLPGAEAKLQKQFDKRFKTLFDKK